MFIVQIIILLSDWHIFNKLIFQIHAVREVVEKNKKYSNDEIVLVLQHYELDVDQAIAAFLEGKLKFYNS